MMLKKMTAIGKFASLALLFSIVSNAALSNTADAIATGSSERSPMSVQPASQFRQIEQPLVTKAIVTIAGISVIGLELWWFLGSKPQARPEQEDK